MRCTRLVLPLVLSAIGCAPSSSGDDAPAPAPLLGKADSTDAADRACQVILRGFADHLGDVDVAPGVEPVTATALYRTPGATGWREAVADELAPVELGFRRFRFRIEDAKPGTELAVFARTASGRLFDHNRVSSDLANYVLDDAGQVAAAPSVCASEVSRATLQFRGDHTQVQHGALVAGGHVTIDYDLSRLTTCRDTHNGYRFWSTDVTVRFGPAYETVGGPVVASNGPTWFAKPFEADIPRDAQYVEIWFRNASPPSCEGWDSNYGANFRFPVLPSAPARVGWAGDWGSSLARDCQHRDGVPEPIVIDEYVRERACAFVDADVWAPGATDDGGHPEHVLAQVSILKDGAAPATEWLAYQGRVGNNARFRWTIDSIYRQMSDWQTLAFTFRFSTDGNTWTEIGPRTVTRAF